MLKSHSEGLYQVSNSLTRTTIKQWEIEERDIV